MTCWADGNECVERHRCTPNRCFKYASPRGVRGLPRPGDRDLVPQPSPLPLGIPTGLCQSGHWWLYVEGMVGDFAEVNVNGTRYQFPTAEWFVANNSYFTAARNSHLRMMWLDGPDVMEKTFAPITNEIGERPASRAPDIEQAAVDQFLEDRSKLIVYQSGGPLLEHEG